MQQWEINAIKEEREYFLYYLKKLGIDSSLNSIDAGEIETCFQSFFEKEHQVHEELTEKIFYEDQIEYLIDLSKDLKEEFNHLLQPILVYLKGVQKAYKNKK